MFGCAFVVTVPALPAVATFKFATCVVLVTVNGAVPVATLDVKVLATTAPAVLIFPAPILPVAVISPAVPKLPTLALPLALNVPVKFAPVEDTI